MFFFKFMSNEGTTIPERLLASRTTARRRLEAAPDRTAIPSTTPAPTPTNRPCSPSTSSRPLDADAFFAKEQIQRCK